MAEEFITVVMNAVIQLIKYSLYFVNPYSNVAKNTLFVNTTVYAFGVCFIHDQD